MDTELRRARRDGCFFTFIIFDIDHFKKLTDTCGHTQDDIALKVIGDVLLESGRRPADFIFRVGGEELGVVIDTQTQAGVLKFAEIIRATVEGLNIPQAHSETSDRMTVSVGLAPKIQQQDDSPINFLTEAEARL
jgi:diguanylate cyclase (GGDEF)-like protein